MGCVWNRFIPGEGERGVPASPPPRGRGGCLGHMLLLEAGWAGAIPCAARPCPSSTDIMGSRVVVQLPFHSQSRSRGAGAAALVGCVLGKPWSCCTTTMGRSQPRDRAPKDSFLSNQPGSSLFPQLQLPCSGGTEPPAPELPPAPSQPEQCCREGTPSWGCWRTNPALPLLCCSYPSCWNSPPWPLQPHFGFSFRREGACFLSLIFLRLHQGLEAAH